VSSEADAIWNRATTDRHLTAPGDRALQAIFVLHGQVRNGGLLSALDYVEPDDYARAVDGFAYFGQDAVADALTRAYAIAFPGGPLPAETREQHTMDLPESVHEEINALDERYAELLPDDATLAAVFEHRLAEHPTDFAPAGD
jgi:hypothetical protein